MAQEIHAQAYGAFARALAGLCVGLWLLAGCSRTADEQALRDTLAAMQAAAEARDADALLDHVADNFAGERGLDKAQLRRLLVVQFMRHPRIGVSLGPLGLRIEGTRAEIEFRLLLTGFQEGLLPARADGYRVLTGWRAEGGRWRLERAQWE